MTDRITPDVALKAILHEGALEKWGIFVLEMAAREEASRAATMNKPLLAGGAYKVLDWARQQLASWHHVYEVLETQKWPKKEHLTTGTMDVTLEDSR